MKMSKRAERALRASIKHWEIDIKEKKEQVLPDGCALCNLYINNSCINCPINIACGGEGCHNNQPLCDYCDYIHEEPNQIESRRKKLADKEIEFLESLLPKKGE